MPSQQNRKSGPPKHKRKQKYRIIQERDKPAQKENELLRAGAPNGSNKRHVVERILEELTKVI